MKSKRVKIKNMKKEEIVLRMRRMEREITSDDKSGNQTNSLHYKHLKERLETILGGK